MRALLFVGVLVLASAAHAQRIRISGGAVSASAGGTCTLDPASTAITERYRATATTGTAFQTDAVLECAFDTGPGTRNCIGTNVSGEILLGPGSGSGTFVRVFGTYQGLDVLAQNFTASNVITYTAALDQGNNGFMRNTNSGKAVLVTDPEGFQINGTTAIRGVVRASVVFDFPTIPNGDCVVQSITVTGAAVGDYVSANADFSLPADVGIGNARVTSANTVDLRLCNHDAALSADPASGAYLIRLER